jgi:P pilus assembly chaperone PapD
MKHKTLLIFLITLISLTACNQASEGGVQLTYTVDEFNLAEDYMQVTVQLANKSATQLKGGKWELHWNQLKGFVDS